MNPVYITQRKAATCANSPSITAETTMLCRVGCGRSYIEFFFSRLWAPKQHVLVAIRQERAGSLARSVCGRRIVERAVL